MSRVILLLSLIFVLSSCARVELASHAIKQFPIAEKNHTKGYFKVGSPYKIAGQTYRPKERYNFTETGTASWYGPNFHGKLTANGEIFDKFELTAAHRTLQMPSLIRVTNLENGRSLVLRVNDRGPFSKGRILDVSERAAELLDFKHKGTAKVKIQVLDKESRRLTQLARAGYDTRGSEVAFNTKKPSAAPRSQSFAQAPKFIQPANPTTSGIFIQAGSFGNHSNAKAFASKLQDFGPTHISPTRINGNSFFRVRLGPVESIPQANELGAQLAAANIGEPIIVVE